MGETTDAIPTPRPPTNLAITSSINVRGKAENTAEIKKRRLQSMRTFFLPVQSEIGPAINAPIVHAIIKLLTANPSWYAFNSNSVLINGIAPDITPVSKPNNNPPNAAITE